MSRTAAGSAFEVRCSMFNVFFAAFLLLSGCATTPQYQASLTGDVLVDGPTAIANGPARDKVLWEYRTAGAAMRQARFAEAKPLLDDALLTLQGIYGKDAEARKARRNFSREARKTFVGEPYERSMAYFYRGVIYWMDGEPDNARACFRSAEFEDSDAEKTEYAGDWVMPDYLDGLATVKLAGDGSDAFRRAREHCKLAIPPDFNPRANVLFFVEFGDGPTKFATGQYGEQLRFRSGVSAAREARIRVGKAGAHIGPYDDVYYQATTRGGRVMDHVLANKAVFKSATDTAGNAALISGAILASQSHHNSAADEVGLGLMLAGLASKIISASTTPEADTRSWDTLPLFLSFAALELPPGQHTVTVEFLDGNRNVLANLTKTLTLNVPPSGDKVVFVSDKSSTPQSL